MQATLPSPNKKTIDDNHTRRLSSFLGVLSGFLCLVGAVLCQPLAAEDWPTFRNNISRTAITQEELPHPLSLQWEFTPLHPPAPAWTDPRKEEARVRFDEAFHVAVVGDSVFFGSSSENKVCCLDAATGQIRWTRILGGPVRVAPSIANGRVYVGCDDGYAYCLEGKNGSTIWKVKGGYRDDKVLGNGQMISLWPVRTGVLVDDGVAYFGAGVFPHESIFICAVNADDGTLLWRNDTCGEIGYKMEFGGITPQGPLLASDKILFVPSGRAMPAAFNKKTGEFLRYLSPGGKVGGTWALLTENELVAGVEEKRVYDREEGKQTNAPAYAWFPGLHLVVAPESAYMLNFTELVALDRKAFDYASKWRSQMEKESADLSKKLEGAEGEERDTLVRQIRGLKERKAEIEDLVHRWRRPCGHQSALILAGETLIAGGQNSILAASAKTGEDLWSAPVEGKACGLAVGNQRLFVSTSNGKVYCFGPGEERRQQVTPVIESDTFPGAELAPLLSQAADGIVRESGITKGYCLVYGCGTGRLAYEIAKRTDLRVIGVDPDPEKVEEARKALDAAGIYGARVTVDRGDLSNLGYSDYFADLIVSETVIVSGEGIGSRDEVLRMLKPYGGVILTGQPAGVSGTRGTLDVAELLDALAVPDEFSAEILQDDGPWLEVIRGPLPGAGKWTHQYADPGNSACSDDQLVKGPLGVLWFGQPGPEKMVERHARAAAPVAMDGRLITQGENIIMAHDSYNGTLLWEREIPGAVRVRVDSDMGNLVLDRDGLYVAAEDKCLRLDPATGEILKTYSMPVGDTKETKRWGYVACVGNALLGSVAPPLESAYGETWNAFLGEDGTWRDLDEVDEQFRPPERFRDQFEEFLTEIPPTDERAYWWWQRGGMMWRSMSPWPAWGSVESPVGAVTERIMASETLFALDTETGETLWTFDGKAIAHPAIAIGDGLVFLADCSATAQEKTDAMAERERLIESGVWEKETVEYPPEDADIRHVVALDLRTGEKRWERFMDLTGCGGDRMGLAYHDGVLCFFGCFSNHDSGLFKDGKLTWRRITTVAGKDGSDMWSRPLNYLRRPVIVGDTILIEPRGCDLKTGEIKTRTHPLTKNDSTWEFVRPGHCCSITSAGARTCFS